MTTVLIVDDEALAIQAIRRSINWKNLDVDRVLDAANGVEAQKILCQEPVQVLVCDLEMPRMSGIELLEWMKTSCPDTEAVILTCHESFPMAQKAMELGCGVCAQANCTGRAYSIHPTCAQPLEDAGKYARDPPRL